MIVDIPKYTEPKPENIPVKVDPVARSLERPDACAKPATIGKPKAGVRVRVTNQRLPGRPRKRKRDYRDVKFF